MMEEMSGGGWGMFSIIQSKPHNTIHIYHGQIDISEDMLGHHSIAIKNFRLTLGNGRGSWLGSPKTLLPFWPFLDFLSPFPFLCLLLTFWGND
jgi:hypothetical protein